MPAGVVQSLWRCALVHEVVSSTAIYRVSVFLREGIGKKKQPWRIVGTSNIIDKSDPFPLAFNPAKGDVQCVGCHLEETEFT